MLREKIKNWKMELAAVLVFVLVLGMTGAIRQCEGGRPDGLENNRYHVRA